MNIKGEYRDVITRNEEIIEDRGWKLNKISDDLGKLIAAMMRQPDFTIDPITYMAVGSSSTAGSNGEEAFNDIVKSKVIDLSTLETKVYYSQSNDWAWAKQIGEVNFLDDHNKISPDITHKLKIYVTFDKNQSELVDYGKLEFKEFALLRTGTYNSNKEIFFINYVSHDPISITFQKGTGANGTDLTRTIQLTFP